MSDSSITTGFKLDAVPFHHYWIKLRESGQAGARAEGRAIAAKGLTGTGYDGHAFWDTETFVLPVLTYTAPRAAASASSPTANPGAPANAGGKLPGIVVIHENRGLNPHIKDVTRRLAVAAPAVPPKCSMEDSEYATSNVSGLPSRSMRVLSMRG